MKRWTSSLMTLVLAAAALGLSAWLGGAMGGRAPAVAVESASTPTGPATREANLAALGRLVYTTQCARCHGPEGHGDGPDSGSLRPPPRDFAADGWRFPATAESIRRVAAEGISGSAMPGFALSARELEAVSGLVAGMGPKSALASALDAARFRAAEPDRSAPGFAMIGIDGRRRSLDASRGRVVLLAFWGTSCGPCLAEMPALERLADAYRDAGLDVLPVCVDEPDPARVAEAVRGRLSRLAPWVDEGMGRLAYDVQSTPTTLLIGRDGRLLGRAEGARDWSGPEVRALIDAAIREGTGNKIR